ncbi:AEC family transporter [Pseudarthrobacter sp. SL88]|uniref:AEC family transporter n=1 Tax=Pseudarthrobacter sp. SL88 TaxID=2994666 RepID=UPI002273F5BF|nr:AEC family transporter [Pseudarthrobacter sp. SL88]MCY1676687.1 AEC family transporter [Pseudarthrobacter sp. SL88]
MGGVLVGLAVIGAVIAVGYLAARCGLGDEHTVSALTKIAFFITNPVLLFTVVLESDISVVFSAYVPLALLTATVTALLYVAASRIWFRRPMADTAVGAMASSYVNANNIGIPITLYALGDATPVAPVLLVQLLLLAPLVLTVLDLSAAGRFSPRLMLTQPFRNPMIIATLLGAVLAAFRVKLPEPVMAPLTLLGGAAVPVVLLAFGMSLRGTRMLRSGGHTAEILTATALKSAVMPAVAYVVGRFLFNLEPHMLLGVVLMAALPPAQNVFLFASRYGRGMAVARETILISTAAAAPVLVLIVWLLAG